MNIDRVLDVVFLGECATSTAETEFRNLLTLHLQWGNRPPQKTARVGMMYVQKGVRWIPQYRLVLDGKGSANLHLQASLINELTDFTNAEVGLVIGVPSFAYKGTLDPLALQQTLAQLSPHFREGRDVLSHALMTQAPRMAESAGGYGGGGPVPDTGPEVTEADKSEDLFVFTVKGVSLRKGERMALPVAEYSLEYKDVYTLYVSPFENAPAGNPLPKPRQGELQSALTAPKVIHKVRLTNTTSHPFTTAPMLLLLGDTVLAQDTMTYTPPKGSLDIPIATAVDIPVKKVDRGLKRTAKSVTINHIDDTLVEVEGTLTLTNYSDKTVYLEVTRHVLGEVQSTTPEAQVSKLSVMGQPITFVTSAGQVGGEMNPLTQIVWKFSLAPGKSAELKCVWQYYTR